MSVNTMTTKKHDVSEELLADYKKPENLIGENGLHKQLTKQPGGDDPPSRTE